MTPDCDVAALRIRQSGWRSKREQDHGLRADSLDDSDICEFLTEMIDKNAINTPAEACAGELSDHKRARPECFRGRFPNLPGYFASYQAKAEEMVRRLRAHGFHVTPTINAARNINRNLVPIGLLTLLVCQFIWIAYRDSNPFLSWTADLGPVPDGPEYLLHAWKLAFSGSVVININGFSWVPRYPPGMIILITPFYWIFQRAEVVASIFPIVTGTACVVVSYLVARQLFNERIGIIFAALISTSPLVVSMSTMVASEVPTATLGIALLGMIHREVTEPSRGSRLLIGFIGGALILIRLESVISLAAAAFFVGAAYAPRDWRKLAEIACLALVMLIAFLIWNHTLYGNPLKTGYDFNVGGWFFSARYFPDNARDLWTMLIGQPVRIVWFTTSVLPAGMALLALLGLGYLWLSRGAKVAIVTAAFVVGSTVPILFYQFREARFHLVLIVAIYLLAAVAADKILAGWLSRWTGASLAAAVTSSVLIFASGDGASSHYDISRSLADRAWRAEDYLALQAMKDDRGTSPIALISALYPPIAIYAGQPNAQAYPLWQHCWSDCARKSKDYFKIDLPEIVKNRRTYITDIEMNMHPSLDFGAICRDIAKTFDVYKLKTVGRYSMYRIGWRYDGTNDCPK